jgi:hypothetical protein
VVNRSGVSGSSGLTDYGRHASYPGTSSKDHFQDNLAGAAIGLTGAEVQAVTQLIPKRQSRHQAPGTGR